MTVSPKLTFTTATSDEAQTVTVSPKNDGDLDDETVEITHAASGSDDYKDKTAELSVEVEDDDTATLRLTPARLKLTEGRAPAAFAVKLSHRPDAAVTLSVLSGDKGAATVAPAKLTFASEDWNENQTVTVTPKSDDDLKNETLEVTLRASGADMYKSVSAKLKVEVTDDDKAGLRLEPKTLEMKEGGNEGKYTLRLSARPSGNVTVQIKSKDTGAVGVSPAKLTFKPADWSEKQTVTLTAKTDPDGEDEEVKVEHTASGAQEFKGKKAEFTVKVIDKDESGLRVEPRRLQVAEGHRGPAPFYTVRLDVRPRQDVIVTVESSDPAAALPQPERLKFTADNWNVRQTVRVIAVPDKDADNEQVALTNAADGDPEYKGKSAIVRVTVVDADAAFVTSSAAVVRVKEGLEGYYSTTLSARPNAEVTVELWSANEEAARVFPRRLMFTPKNWQKAQAVTVSTSEDADAEDSSVEVTLEPSGGGYDDSGSGKVMVLVTEEDEPADTTHPRVSSLQWLAPRSSPTDADELAWRVAFSEAVDGVDAEDFMLTGTSAALSVAGVSEDAYDVTASGGDLSDLNGAVTLWFAGGVSVTDKAGNALLDTEPTGASQATFQLRNLDEQKRATFEHALASFGGVLAQRANEMVGQRLEKERGGVEIRTVTTAMRTSNEAQLVNAVQANRLARQSMDPARHAETAWNPFRTRVQSQEQMLSSTSFSLTDSSGELGGVSVWAQGGQDMFNQSLGNGWGYDGRFGTGWFGADTMLGESVLGGAAIAGTRGRMEYKAAGDRTGAVGVSLTAVHPYVGMRTPEGSGWAMVGIGSGTVADSEDPAAGPLDLSMRMLATGFERDIGLGLLRGMRVSLIGGGEFANLRTGRSAATSELAGLNVLSWRMRTGVETDFRLLGLRPKVSVALRRDGGDGVTGNGLEVGTGLDYSLFGVKLKARGRWLAVHTDSEHKELALSLGAERMPDSLGRGLSIRVLTGRGAQLADGGQSYLERDTVFGRRFGPTLSPLSFDSHVGYGLPLWRRGTITPYACFSTYGQSQKEHRIGFSLTFVVGSNAEDSKGGGARSAGTCRGGALGVPGMNDPIFGHDAWQY